MNLKAASSINNSGYAFNPNGISKTLARIGEFIPDKVQDFCDLTPTGSLKRTTFFVIAATLVLGARYFQARNKDEKREVLTRDSVAVATAIYAVPLLKKFAGMFINKKIGIPISYGEGGVLKNLNPEKGIKMATFDQLAEWFSVKNVEAFNGIKNGFTGFCENIKNLGGNLMKSFNMLDKNSSNTLNELAKNSGFKQANNENIIKILEKAEISTNQNTKQKLDSLKAMFVGENKLVTRASHLKAITEFGCIAATAFLLGGLLPWFNIQHTKKLYEKKKSENNNLNDNSQKTLPINNQNMMEKFKKFQTAG
jgi:hypothetical protein